MAAAAAAAVGVTTGVKRGRTRRGEVAGDVAPVPAPARSRSTSRGAAAAPAAARWEVGLRFYHKPGLAWLSNFERAPFRLRGVMWPTAEHYFQAAKFFDTDPAYAEVVRATGSPGAAKAAGRSRAHPLDPAWEAIKEGVMRDALTAKFAPGTDLAARLMATAPHVLIEDAPRDYYWGAGASGTGRNRLGVLLGEVRAGLLSAAGGAGAPAPASPPAPIVAAAPAPAPAEKP